MRLLIHSFLVKLITVAILADRLVVELPGGITVHTARCLVFEGSLVRIRILLLQHGLADDYLLQAMLAKDHIFQTAGILCLRLHQLHETICDLIPLPVDHDVEYAGECVSSLA